MSFVFRCPRCHAEHTAASSIAGRRVRCPACFEVVESQESDDIHSEPFPRPSEPADTVVLTEMSAKMQAGDGFDPYQQWLGIPPEHQPPNFYRLLDLPAFEPDAYVISGAADRQAAKVRGVEDSQHAPERARLVEEIARAKECLTNPEQKVTYDRRLQKQLKKVQKAEQGGAKASGAVEQPLATSEPDQPPIEVAAPEKPQDDSAATDLTAPVVAEPIEQAAPDEPVPLAAAGSVAAPPAAAAPPKVAPPPVIQPVPLSGDLGVRALMHVDEEDDEAGETFVSFADDRTEFESEMDMTPMVDVTFLLLIFFMVTSSFSLQKSIEQPVQKQDEPSTNVTQQEFEDNPDYVVVQIDEFDSFRVIAADFEEEAPSEQELLIKLRRARDGRGGRVPTKLLVAASGEASHGRVVMAMDAGTEVGMEQVQFTLAPESDF